MRCRMAAPHPDRGTARIGPISPSACAAFMATRSRRTPRPSLTKGAGNADGRRFRFGHHRQAVRQRSNQPGGGSAGWRWHGTLLADAMAGTGGQERHSLEGLSQRDMFIGINLCRRLGMGSGFQPLVIRWSCNLGRVPQRPSDRLEARPTFAFSRSTPSPSPPGSRRPQCSTSSRSYQCAS